MTQSLASSTEAPRARRKRRQPTSGYLFVVSALAVFFAALVLGLGFRPRDPVKAIVAPALNIEPASTSERMASSVVQLESVARTIQSEATISQTLELIGKFDGTSLDRSLTPAKFQQDLQVVVRPSVIVGQHELFIDYRGSAPGATEVVNQLATTAVQQYERQFEQPARQKHYQAQQEATSAERKAASALRRYEQFISRLQTPVLDAAEAGLVSTTRIAKSASEQGSGNGVDAKTAMLQNPAWRELADQQQRLARRRTELLEQMTIEHPLIRQLDVDLAQLDQNLSQTPRFIDNLAAGESAGPAVANTTPSTAENSTPELPGEQQLLFETQRLRAESVAADKLFVQRQAELLTAANELQAAHDGRLEVLRWAEKPALIRGSDGVTLIVAALLAWLVGSAVAAHGVPADETFTAPEEAAAQLATPVLAVLPTNEHCPTAIYPQLPSSTRWVARACEVVLAAMIIMAVSLLIADQSFRTQLLSHPLSSIPHGIDRFRDLMQS